MADSRPLPRGIDARATLACLGALAGWSLGPIFIKYLTPWVDSWTQNALRYSIACLFLLPLLARAIRNNTLDRRIWKRAIPPSAANIIMQSFWAAAFYYLKPAFMTMLIKTNVLWVATLSLLLFPNERALIRSWRFWAGLAMSMTGVIGVLYFKQDFSAEGTGFGIFLTLTVAVLWAFYAVSARIAFRDIDSGQGFAVVTIYSVIGLWVLDFIFGEVGRIAHIPLTPWLVIIISGIISIAISHSLYYSAMRRIGATIPALIILTQPFLVLAVSYFAFDETLVLKQLLFGGVLLFGSALAICAESDLGKSPGPPQDDSA